MLLIFDIDGTLTKDNRVGTEAFRMSVADMFGISGYSENWSEYKNDADTGIVNDIVAKYRGRNLSKNEIREFQKHYLECFDKLLSLPDNNVLAVDGAAQFLESLKDRCDVRVALFTGGFPLVARRKLELISIDKELLLSAALDGFSREEIFRKCISCAKAKYGVEFRNTVLFGDSMSDIEISKKFGIPLVGITTQLSADIFLSAGAKAAVKNYRDVKVEELKDYGYC